MKELEYFEEKIKNIIDKNEINNFYVFAESILEQENKYGEDEIKQKYNLDEDDLFYLKVYTDALKIGDFTKDVFKDFNLEKLSQIEEKSLNDSLQKSIEKYNNTPQFDRLIDSLNS